MHHDPLVCAQISSTRPLIRSHLRLYKHGHTELSWCYFLHPAVMGHLTTTTAWKMWFFTNYEHLISKVDSNPAVARASADEPGESTKFIAAVASGTRSVSTNWSSRSPTVTVADAPSESR